MKSFLLTSCIGILAFASANAQEYSKFSFDLGGGYTTPVGGTGRYLDEGWNIRAGAGFNFSGNLGAMLNLGYDQMGINSYTLSTIGVPGGGVHIFHATVDPVVRLRSRGHSNFYLTAGGGVFHMYQNFTAPAVVTTDAFNPFSGFFPVSYGANQVLSSYTVTKPGFDVGGGVEVGAFNHGKFFAEAKWEHMFLTGAHVDYIPVSFGFRW
jgi:Outer membrane protein beta-barrel domain